MIVRLILLCAVMCASGCTATHLAYVHSGDLGIDLGASPQEGNVKLVVGYDRRTYAIVPRTGNGPGADAMSVTSAERVVVQGLDIVKFGHIVATGAPAVGLAKHPQNIGELVHKLFGDQTGDKK